jgi:hypothetical protein
MSEQRLLRKTPAAAGSTASKPAGIEINWKTDTGLVIRIRLGRIHPDTTKNNFYLKPLIPQIYGLPQNYTANGQKSFSSGPARRAA